MLAWCSPQEFFGVSRRYRWEERLTARELSGRVIQWGLKRLLAFYFWIIGMKIPLSTTDNTIFSLLVDTLSSPPAICSIPCPAPALFAPSPARGDPPQLAITPGDVRRGQGINTAKRRKSPSLSPEGYHAPCMNSRAMTTEGKALLDWLPLPSLL